MEWGKLFFDLHHYCNLGIDDILDKYSLPQIQLLIKYTNQHIKFVVETSVNPMMAMFGGGTSGDSAPVEEEHTATEEDIARLERFLSGGTM